MYKVSRPYILLIDCYVGYMVFYRLRLFVVDGEHIAMAMVVVGHICTPNIMVVQATSYRLIHCLCCHGNIYN